MMIIITKDRKGTRKHSTIVEVYMLQSNIDKLTKPFPVAQRKHEKASACD